MFAPKNVYEAKILPTGKYEISLNNGKELCFTITNPSGEKASITMNANQAVEFVKTFNKVFYVKTRERTKDFCR